MPVVAIAAEGNRLAVWRNGGTKIGFWTNRRRLGNYPSALRLLL